MERRVAQHHVQRVRRLPGQAVAGADIHWPVAERCLPVLPGRLHGHVGLVDQGVVRLRVVQRAGDGEHAVAATEVGHSCRAEVLRQVREEGAGADVQAFAAEHVGVVEQFDLWLVEPVTRGVGRYDRRTAL
ncbi:hypothetical protein D3C76_1372740 [compost metagenome]